MNDRIKDMALDAIVRYPAVDAWVFTDEELKKFAESIVAECLEACSRANEIRHFVPPTQEQVVLSCMREIERTFRI